MSALLQQARTAMIPSFFLPNFFFFFLERERQIDGQRGRQGHGSMVFSKYDDIGKVMVRTWTVMGLYHLHIEKGIFCLPAATEGD